MKTNTTTHKEARQQFYKDYPHFWHDIHGEEYALFDVHLIKESFANETRTFAEEAGRIFFKTCRFLQQESVSNDMLLALGYPPETLGYIRLHSTQSPTIIGRIDSILHEGVHKIIEFNSETPFIIQELFRMNGEVAAHFGRKNPNEGMEEQLQQALKNSILEAYAVLGNKEFPHIVFTSHQNSKEDYHTTRYLQKICPLPSTYVPLEDLVIEDGVGLFDPDGHRIDVLYRHTYPIEQLVKDKDDDGNPIGQQLVQLVLDKKLAILNPPSAFLMQSKALLSVIWGLHEESSPFFTAEEHAFIEKHFLPTYLEKDYFLATNQAYVRKPVFGRVGDSVEVYDGEGQMTDEDKHKTYQQYINVYQKHLPLPTTNYETSKGIKTGHIVYGSFVINGQGSAFGIRVGDAITNDSAQFLPIGFC